MTDQDKWLEWLTVRRFGGRADIREATMVTLNSIADSVLAEGRIAEGDTVVDVGCGDGLLGFKASSLVGAKGRVILVDASGSVIAALEELLASGRILGRFETLNESVENLVAIKTGTVHVVVARAVLSYVENKQAAFREFFRILQPSGRLSIWEPVNKFVVMNQVVGSLAGFEVAPVADLVGKLGLAKKREDVTSDPLLSFDERDLLQFARDAGFADVTLKYEAVANRRQKLPWEVLFSVAPNPAAQTLEELVRSRLTPEEARRFIGYLKPMVETQNPLTLFASAHIIARVS